MKTEDLLPMALTHEFLSQAVELCGNCVGENLYTESELTEAIKQPEKEFILLMTPQNEAAAYIYFRLIDLQEAQKLANHSLEQLLELGFDETVVIGNLQSIGVSLEYRNHHLSEWLMKIYLKWLTDKTKADIAFGVFWKPCGIVSMEKTLKKFGFRHLTDSYNVWYNKEDLICPVCKGRCRCDAAIYYKRIERNVIG